MPYVEIEFFRGGQFRIFADGGRYGDPYQKAITFRWVDPHTIELTGVTNGSDVPTPDEARDILRLAKQLGLKLRRERKSGANPGTKTYQ